MFSGWRWNATNGGDAQYLPRTYLHWWATNVMREHLSWSSLDKWIEAFNNERPTTSTIVLQKTRFSSCLLILIWFLLCVWLAVPSTLLAFLRQYDDSSYFFAICKLEKGKVEGISRAEWNKAFNCLIYDCYWRSCGGFIVVADKKLIKYHTLLQKRTF